jgi:hypothetical protein
MEQLIEVDIDENVICRVWTFSQRPQKRLCGQTRDPNRDLAPRLATMKTAAHSVKAQPIHVSELRYIIPLSHTVSTITLAFHGRHHSFPGHRTSKEGAGLSYKITFMFFLTRERGSHWKESDDMEM